MRDENRSDIKRKKQGHGPPAFSIGNKWKLYGRWIAAAVGFLAALAGLAAFVLQMVERKSNVDTVAVTAEMYGTAYAVPVSAPFEDFPTNFSPSEFSDDWESCSPEQKAWLENHGERMVEVGTLTMRNTAESGALLTVEDISTRGTMQPGPAHVRVECAEPIGGTIGTQEGELIADASSTAQFMPFPGGAAGPVTYTLQPGETARTRIWFHSHRDAKFEGSLTAQVVGGQETKTVTIELSGDGPAAIPTNGSTFTIPSWAATEHLVVSVGRDRGQTTLFECKEMETMWSSTGNGGPCTPAELRSKLDTLVGASKRTSMLD